MSARSSSRRRGRSQPPAYPTLPAGVRAGLLRLVSDNAATVASMLDVDVAVGDDTAVDVLCEKCASVMRQQQLSASSFLARFFDVDVLRAHASLLGKSEKGTAPTLAERIGGEWAKNNVPPPPTTVVGASSGKRRIPAESPSKDAGGEEDGQESSPKKSKQCKEETSSSPEVAEESSAAAEDSVTKT